MSLIDDFAVLKKMPASVVKTNDAAALWSMSPATASTMLARLEKAGHIMRLTRGSWLLEMSAHPWSLQPYLTDPSPGYISLQTALFHHGMIEQIPEIIHVITTAKSRRLKTPVGTYFMHQVAPGFFYGFEPLNGGPAQMATPEKALVDFLYFRPAKSRDFRALPELELPKSFNMKLAKKFAAPIASLSRRHMVERLLSEINNPDKV